LFAGHETTTNLIGAGVLVLLRNPGEVERLGADPSLVPNAVEELLRYEGPSKIQPRLAAEDLEIRRPRIQRGARVFLVPAAAVLLGGGGAEPGSGALRGSGPLRRRPPGRRARRLRLRHPSLSRRAARPPRGGRGARAPRRASSPDGARRPSEWRRTILGRGVK